MSASRKSWCLVALVAGAVLVAGACQENLAGGAACPSLCPDTLLVEDTVLQGSVAFDTVLTAIGAPPLGTEQQILVGNFVRNGQRVETAAILRWDSLTTSIPDTTPGKGPRFFDRVDSSAVLVNVVAPDSATDSLFVTTDSLTFQLFDVDTDATDLDTAAVRARIGSTLVGSVTVGRRNVGGSMRIPIDTGFFASHIRAGQRVRLALVIRGDGDGRIQIGTQDAGNGTTVRYNGFVGTAEATEILTVNSRASAGAALQSLADYMLPIQGSPPPPPDVLVVGGLPPRRVYIRFNIPADVLDSSTDIVRANLELHQLGNDSFASADTLQLLTRVVRATPSITDIAASAVLVVDPATLSATVPPRVISPQATQPDTIPVVGLFNLWKREGVGRTQHAIVLESSGEGLDPREYFFFSSTAAVDSLRPRLRISFVPKSGFGLP